MKYFSCFFLFILSLVTYCWIANLDQISLSEIKISAPQFYTSYSKIQASSKFKNGNLRVGSYNIAHARGNDTNVLANFYGGGESTRTKRLAGIAQFLKDEELDVVVLNEVDFNTSWSFWKNQAEYIASLGGYNYIVEQRNYDSSLLFFTIKTGNALLSKYPIKSVEPIDFPHAQTPWSYLFGYKKSMIVTVLLPSGKEIEIIPIHLDSVSANIREQSLTKIKNIVKTRTNEIIMAGDFNCHIKHIECVGDVLGDQQATFPSRAPKQRLDWIVSPTGLELSLLSHAQERLSDHLPVTAEVTLSPFSL